MFRGNDNLYVAGLVAWITMLVGAVLNGVLREKILAPRIGSVALSLSAVTGALIFTLITYLLLKWLHKVYATQALITLGIIWLLLTVVFEFTFGHYVLGKDWSELWAAYDLRTGNLWSALLLYIVFLPFILAKWLEK